MSNKCLSCRDFGKGDCPYFETLEAVKSKVEDGIWQLLSNFIMSCDFYFPDVSELDGSSLEGVDNEEIIR
jgi:hypothetical protein